MAYDKLTYEQQSIKIKELESEVARLKKLIQDIQSPSRDDDFDDWYYGFDEYRTYGG